MLRWSVPLHAYLNHSLLCKTFSVQLGIRLEKSEICVYTKQYTRILPWPKTELWYFSNSKPLVVLKVNYSCFDVQHHIPRTVLAIRLLKRNLCTMFFDIMVWIKAPLSSLFPSKKYQAKSNQYKYISSIPKPIKSNKYSLPMTSVAKWNNQFFMINIHPTYY